MKGKSGKNKNNRNNSNTATTTTTASASALIRPESNTTATTTATTPKARLAQPAGRLSTTGGGNTTTTVGTGLVTSSNSSAAAAAAATTILSQQDVHPYARGSVIEVWHISKTNQKNNDEDDWWTDDDDDDDDDESDIDPQQLQKREKTILLCDIIDRVPTTTTTGNNNKNSNKSKATTTNSTSSNQQHSSSSSSSSWRYYVHYRDYNRRMDEWIPSSRIVSPPSVGNAKVRALKKQEMIQLRNKRKQQQQQQLATGITGGGIGNSVSTLDLKMATNNSTTATTIAGSTTTSTTTTTTTSSAMILDRRTRRRKSTKPDPEDTDGMMILDANANAMDITNNTTKTPSPLKQPLPPTDISNNNKQQQQQQQPPLLTTTTIQVGEHIVATIQAVELDEHEGMDEASLREHEEVTKIKNVGFLELGRHQMETWYYSPLPKEIINGNTGGNLSSNNNNNNNHQGFLDVLYVCEFTLRMFARKRELQRFQARVPILERHPPGNEIYRHENLAMFEVDGSEEKIYCQNLCYIAKLFLDHKTLYYDVDPFLFYVLCELDERGYHPVGYFSKEKYSDVGYNLACILSFPAHQRKGYGRFLIAFSYELTKKEEKVGSPEKPMSDLGQQAYKPYWASTIIDFLLNQSDETSLSIMDISKRTSIMSDDIVFTLNQLGILKIINGVYFIAAEQGMLMELAKKYPIKEPRIDPSKLHWTPYLTDIRRDKFSIHSKKQSLDAETTVV